MSVDVGREDPMDVVGSFSVVPVSRNALHTYWTWKDLDVEPLFKYSEIYYTLDGRISRLPPLLDPTITSARLDNLQTDTYYRVCLRVTKAGHLAVKEPDQVCRDVRTHLWHLPAIIGSAVGACLAVLLVIALLLISQKLRSKSRRQRYNTSVTSVGTAGNGAKVVRRTHGSDSSEPLDKEDDDDISFTTIATPTDSLTFSQGSTLFSQNLNNGKSPQPRSSVSLRPLVPENLLANCKVSKRLQTRCDSTEETSCFITTPECLSLENINSIGIVTSPCAQASAEYCPSDTSSSSSSSSHSPHEEALPMENNPPDDQFSQMLPVSSNGVCTPSHPFSIAHPQYLISPAFHQTPSSKPLGDNNGVVTTDLQPIVLSPSNTSPVTNNNNNNSTGVPSLDSLHKENQSSQHLMQDSALHSMGIYTQLIETL